MHTTLIFLNWPLTLRAGFGISQYPGRKTLIKQNLNGNHVKTIIIERNSRNI